MKPLYVTKAVLEALKQCPNCDGKLERINRVRIQCQKCGYNFTVESRISRWATFAFMAAMVAFGFGLILGSFLI